MVIWEVLGLAILAMLVLSGVFWVILAVAIPVLVVFALGVAALAVVGALVVVVLSLAGALGGLVGLLLTAGGPLLLALGLGFLLWTATGRKRFARVKKRTLERRPRCPKCFRTVPKDASVCPHCLADLWGNCPACGRIHRLGVLFCPECGTSLRRHSSRPLEGRTKS